MQPLADFRWHAASCLAAGHLPAQILRSHRSCVGLLAFVYGIRQPNPAPRLHDAAGSISVDRRSESSLWFNCGRPGSTRCCPVMTGIERPRLCKNANGTQGPWRLASFLALVVLAALEGYDFLAQIDDTFLFLHSLGRLLSKPKDRTRPVVDGQADRMDVCNVDYSCRSTNAYQHKLLAGCRRS